MKYKEISQKDVAQLKKDLIELQDKVVELRVKVKLGQAKNIHELKQARKTVARIKTYLTAQTN